ncbi:hypothetical protein [Streptomyces cinnamoneus]|uniref:hypothetical protein n=1 Tax=Streptomyces cinnamoneus TaxID=53446 RepID=UPI000CEF3B09|nr:hypothetical protein [Streptomyces cinnamoneus]PPT14778.1 hypothetical protein CYQ11_19575 [Streptomyces cinnamoneus]
MITVSSMANPGRPPAKPADTIRVASLDAEWTKNFRIKNGNRPFCFSVVLVDVPIGDGPAALDELPFAYTSVYLEDPAETQALVDTAADTIAQVFADADLITGHQLCSDLAVLAANADTPPPALTSARGAWSKRRVSADDAPQVLDTRYDAGHLLTGTSRRLVDVCTELNLDVTQPELLRHSMPKLHRRWLENGDIEARERVSVLNVRHSLSTALVAIAAAGHGHWDSQGLNVNRMIATHAEGAWGWLTSRTFRDLLGEPCPSGTAPS